MMNRNKLFRIFVILLTAVMLFSTFAASAAGNKNRKNTEAETAEAMAAAQEIADYLFEYGELPDHFIRKKEAQELGWDPKVKHNCVSDVAPGKSIGGDYFGNYEERLPVVNGRKYYEADCYYFGGDRNEYRIIYSNDGHVWFTGDHYNTFIELFPSKEGEE